jgi:hypothetical protein
MLRIFSRKEAKVIEGACRTIAKNAKTVLRNFSRSETTCSGQIIQSGAGNKISVEIGARGSSIAVNNFRGSGGFIYDIEIKVRESKKPS